MRSFVVGKAKSKRGREREANNQQCTMKMHTKTATSKRSCFSNALPHTSNGGSGKRAARERSEGEKSTELPGCTGRGEGGGRHKARGCGSRDEHAGDAGVS